MWINMLEVGHNRSRKSSIFNMIEWIGASEWFDAEIEEAEKAPPPTKRGVPRKRLATIILIKYMKEAYGITEIEATGTLAFKNSEDCPSFMDSAKVEKKFFDARRLRLNVVIQRGRILRRLVQATHLGILFDENIWKYIKSGQEHVNRLAETFQADPRKMKLLSILDEQVELLAKEGRPNLSSLFDSLETNSLISSEEVSNLRTEYGLEEEPVSQLCLEAAINRVVEEIGHVLGKSIVGDQDCIMINGTGELSCGMFNRLRSRAWLKNWDIAAALEMADKSPSVRHYLSIPFHKEDINGKIMPISNPLRGWRKKIDDWRAEVENDIERQQVYICPLNVSANHFTLLEINEETKMIYHYDSMASPGIRQRKKKSSLVGRAIEAEFRHLGFKYAEAPTPQQEDSWSCGLMVIRNAKRRMNGLAVGGWHDRVNPDRVIRDIVGDCQVFLANGALQPSPLSKKRKRIVEDLQDDIEQPSRSSKRLRDITKDS
ncbi:hypothetical protein B0O99DRAFT_159895 [Bisporella sp. PMI_857]|nr:hypothetical protein B0O99DRAFT_159895 [Bisporella sp. PMI_857]